MKVRNSITLQGEKLTNVQLGNQWNNIDWNKAENHVNRLQIRITKAVTECKWYLVKRLQYLLTHSYYAKLLATRKPTQNTGKRTAGVDGETWSSSEAKMKAALSLTDKKYVAKPLKRVYIEKYGSKKKRPLGIPTMYDRAMQSLYALALEPIAEATGDKTSFGFRKFRSYVFERQLFPTEAGTPQGGIISPILANLTLDGIEKILADKYHKTKL